MPAVKAGDHFSWCQKLDIEQAVACAVLYFYHALTTILLTLCHSAVWLTLSFSFRALRSKSRPQHLAARSLALGVLTLGCVWCCHDTVFHKHTLAQISREFGQLLSYMTKFRFLSLFFYFVSSLWWRNRAERHGILLRHECSRGSDSEGNLVTHIAAYFSSSEFWDC